MPWSRPSKIAFIGSHSVRKSNAASHVTADFDWRAIADRLAAIVGEPLVEVR